MIRFRRSMLCAALVCSLMNGPGMAADLLTMEQAEALAKETGRPILAMAGSKT